MACGGERIRLLVFRSSQRHGSGSSPPKNMLAIILVRGYTVVTRRVWGNEGNADPQALLGTGGDEVCPSGKEKARRWICMFQPSGSRGIGRCGGGERSLVRHVRPIDGITVRVAIEEDGS